jgi:aminobenzoyl-glutamate utilization protein A
MDKRLFDEMIATRRHLHTMPEEGWTEFETTYFIVKRLREIGYETVLAGKDIIDPASVRGRSEELVNAAVERALGNGVPAEFIEACGRYTGAAAILKTGRPGPVTALRFDIDCVCVQETDDPEHAPNKLGFRSGRKGLMHACGHDGHTSVGLAVARDLFEHRDALCGTIKLIFQPAEEGVRGAVAIVGSGILDDVDIILGSHVGGKCKLGHVGLVHGGVLASTKLDIYFEGVPSHAGNAPEKGKSALMAACATAMMMAGIPRHGEGASRVAVGKLIAGEGRNVVPAHAYIQTEVRGETAAVNDFMVKNVEQIVAGNALAYGVQSRIVVAGEATTIIECPEILDIVREIARDVPGVEAIDELSTPAGSEDFTMMLKRVVEHGGRGGMFRWGCNHHGHHKRDFELQDTESMPVGFEVFSRFVRRVNRCEG